jgi:uncharacterized protein (TIGR00255 family)
MIKSMTGYGRATGSFDGMDITLELKSVNHRYFEFSSRVPRIFGFLDEKLKSFFQGKISRGKVECYVQIDTAGEESAVVKLNSALAKGYLAAYKELSETCGIENDIKVSDLARVNDIFTVSKSQKMKKRFAPMFSALRQKHSKDSSPCVLSRAESSRMMSLRALIL